MGFFDRLKTWLDDFRGTPPAPTPDPPPIFTRGPRPYAIAERAFGIEWETDQRTCAVLTVRTPAAELVISDESRAREHRHGIQALLPDTEYAVTVEAFRASSRTVRARAGLTLRTLASPVPPEPEPTEPPPPEPGGEPIPHAPSELNLLARTERPWRRGAVTVVDPAWAAWLVRYCRGGRTHLIVADMPRVPEAMRFAGFRGRNTALWYTLSRSYAGWPWSFKGDDPDAHLSDQRQELRAFWANYLSAISAAMQAAPETTALLIERDAEGHCGRTLGNHSARQLSGFGARVQIGTTVQD